MPLERVSQGFKDLSMSFQVNPLNDDLIGLKNENAIARSIRNIVFTLPGEKFFNEDFGSQISASLFESYSNRKPPAHHSAQTIYYPPPQPQN